MTIVVVPPVELEPLEVVAQAAVREMIEKWSNAEGLATPAAMLEDF